MRARVCVRVGARQMASGALWGQACEPASDERPRVCPAVPSEQRLREHETGRRHRLEDRGVQRDLEADHGGWQQSRWHMRHAHQPLHPAL